MRSDSGPRGPVNRLTDPGSDRSRHRRPTTCPHADMASRHPPLRSLGAVRSDSETKPTRPFRCLAFFSPREASERRTGPGMPEPQHHDAPRTLAWRPLQRSTRLAILLALLVTASYQLFLLDPSHRGNTVLWAAMIVAELIT